METNTNTEILNLVDKSQNILLLTHAKADCDGLGSMLSLYLTLKELGKNVTAATNDPAADNLSFLPSLDVVTNSITSKDFIIKLDTSKNALSKIKYHMDGDFMNIVITPKGDTFSEKDVSFGRDGAKFDLIVVMDAGNLEHLGAIYDKNTELFFEAPIINIDHHTSNTDFGQINLVDPIAASTTEILFTLLKEMEKKYDKKFITEDVATLLLSGIITDTGSFQHSNTSPHSMETSAELLDLGARQQEIIKNIYKTKKLSTLKLWGSVLSKVKVDPIYRMVWSTISEEDFRESGAKPEESEGVVDDLLTNAPGAEVIFLVKYNDKNLTSVSMRSTSNQIDVGKITTELGGGGHIRAAGFKVRDGRSFDQVVSETIAKVREYQAKRLNIHPEIKVENNQINNKKVDPRLREDDNGTKQEIPTASANQQEKPEVQSPKLENKTEKKETYLDFKSPDKKETENKTQETKQEIPTTRLPDRQASANQQGTVVPQQKVQETNPQHKPQVNLQQKPQDKNQSNHNNNQKNQGFDKKNGKQFKSGNMPKPQFKKFEKREDKKNNI